MVLVGGLGRATHCQSSVTFARDDRTGALYRVLGLGGPCQVSVGYAARGRVAPVVACALTSTRGSHRVVASFVADNAVTITGPRRPVAVYAV